MNHLRFVAQKGDFAAAKACEFLASLGYTVRLLEENGEAKAGEVALYTAEKQTSFPGKWLRVVAFRLEQVPTWAMVTPFVVAIKNRADIARVMTGNIHPGIQEALTLMARSYHAWNPQNPKKPTPWLADPVTPAPEHMTEYQLWQRGVEYLSL